jgi:hypothetical protein
MTAIASAQPAADPAGAPAPAPDGTEPVPAAAPAPAPHPNTNAAMMQPPPPPPPPSGPTLRNGLSLSIGQEMGTSNLMNEFSGQLYGIDWRIGAQINKAIGVYLDTHMSLGAIQINNVDDYTGNIAAAVIGEYQLPMRLFFGAGAGFGVLNNPSGPLVQGRIGYYLFEKTSMGKSRRLNIAFDTRLYFVSEGPESLTMKHFALSIGYDRF